MGLTSTSRASPVDGLDVQQDLLAGFAAQQLAFVGDIEQVLAVDADDDFAFLDKGLGTGERRRLIGQIGVVDVDVLDDVAAGFLVAPQNGAERGDVDVVGRLARVSAADEGVQRGELADHLRDNVVQFVAVGDAIDEGQIAVAHGGPIDALHVAVVEVVALQPPGIEKEAAELFARIGGEGPVREIDCALAMALGSASAAAFTSESRM